MAYSTNEQAARDLALKLHANQRDKAGQPYSGHITRVAERCAKPEERVVGYLHDSVEDSEYTGFSLAQVEAVFGADTARAVDCMTHREGESWADYLCRVKTNPVACAVKISDLIDNSNLSRLPCVKAKDVERQAKYNRALRFLMEMD